MAVPKPKVPEIRHPVYLSFWKDWEKWRRVYDAGDDFVECYLRKFSNRERLSDFRARKEMAPIPAFAKAAVNDVKNSIFQRMSDITRTGGSKAYQEAVLGLDKGVDLCGTTMSGFIGQELLPELLTMSRVGVYVDMPPLSPDPSVFEASIARPYLYMYRIEDILSWSYRDVNQPDEFQAVLLRDHCLHYDPETSLACGEISRYRYVYINPETGFVNVRFYDQEGKQIAQDGSVWTEPVELSIRTIPFVMFDIKQSLIEDVANHQIALLNLGSSDVAYALKANFPFVTMQADLRQQSSHLREPSNGAVQPVEGGQPSTSAEIEIGPVQGLQYDISADRPEYIHPSPEPLQASMALQEKLKEDIRLLVNLAVTNINPKMASAESKQLDMAGLESGLSYIGLVLENGERQIARYWASYDNSTPATVKYPERYSIKSDSERRAEAKDHSVLKFTVPSVTFQKRISRDVIEILLGNKVSREELATMIAEVDAAEYQTSEVDIIEKDLAMRLVSTKTASKARGYKPGESEVAREEHIEFVTDVTESQTEAAAEATASVAEDHPDLNAPAPAPAADPAKPKAEPVRGAGKKTTPKGDE